MSFYPFDNDEIKISVDDKIHFLQCFSLLLDAYSGNNNYQRLSMLIRNYGPSDERPEEYEYETYSDISDYAALKMKNFDGALKITNPESYYGPINDILEKGFDESFMENTPEIKELNKLFTVVKSEHPLVKALYHFALLKILDATYYFDECTMFGSTKNFNRTLAFTDFCPLPIVNLDFNSEENQKVFAEIFEMQNKYPHVFLDELSKKDKALENTKKTIEVLQRKSKSFFSSFVEGLNIDNVLSHFLEADSEYLKNKILNNKELKLSFSVHNISGKYGAPECGHTSSNAVTLELDIPSTIRANQITLQGK